MQTVFSKAFMEDNCGCYKKEEGKLESMVLKGRDEITYQDIIECKIPLKDKYWFFCKKVFSKEQNQQIAIQIAECVLPIYEAKYPDNKAPREAIEAAKLYITGHISLEKLLAARGAASRAAARAVTEAAVRAANAADAAVRAAVRAANAADAAVMAVYAANAAKYAACADEDATWAAADAAKYAACAADDAYKIKLTELLSNFIKENN